MGTAIWRRIALAIAIAAPACGRIGFDPDRDDGDDGGDDGGVPCTSFDAWEEPTHLGDDINSGADDSSPMPSLDELTLYFESSRPGGAGNRDLWVATRTSTEATFGAPVNVTAFNSASNDTTPSLSPDNTEFVFTSNTGASDTLDMYVAARTGVTTFAPQTLIAVLAADGVDESGADISADGLTMYYARSEPPTADAEIARATRATTADPWVLDGLVPEVNLATQIDRNPAISPDDLELYFESDRGSGNRIYVARRTSASTAFAPPTEVTELTTLGNNNKDPALSGDGRTIYFASSRPGGAGNLDLWMARRGCALTTLR